MLRFPVLWISLAALVLTNCDVAPERDPAIGEAYAGPATLNLRKDIDPKSPVVAIAHHGDRLEITAQRRRWYKVRTARGVEGWTDDRELLDTGQMNRLRTLAKETSGMPSQGAATTFDILNVHTEPMRLAPSFLQVKEGEKFDVIAHRVLPRTAPPKRRLVLPRPKPDLSKRKKKKRSGVQPPPAPAPPVPPNDWVALSKERARVPEDDLPPVARDDWTLIRTRDGRSGWVLTGRVYMAIPDEVAQYAEGHRITSYFSIGKVVDGDVTKDVWLWTTAASLGEDHDFDGYRVFTWSLRRHRYETAFIQRRERGYFPVLAKQGAFSVCLEDDSGARVRRSFVMLGNLVKAAGEAPCASAPDVEQTPQDAANIQLHQAPARTGFIESMKAHWRKLTGS